MNISLFLYGVAGLKGYIFLSPCHSLGHSNSLKSVDRNEFHVGDGNSQEVTGKEGKKAMRRQGYHVIRRLFSIQKECLSTLIYSTKLYWALIKTADTEKDTKVLCIIMIPLRGDILKMGWKRTGAKGQAKKSLQMK